MYVNLCAYLIRFWQQSYETDNSHFADEEMEAPSLAPKVTLLLLEPVFACSGAHTVDHGEAETCL